MLRTRTWAYRGDPVVDSERLLVGTPYLMASDSASTRRFEAAMARSADTRERATRTNDRIKLEARDVLEPYLKATRTDLVAESNVIEGMQWSAQEVREVVATHRELLAAPVRTLVESVRADPRVYEALGLYRAHEIAEAWSQDDRVPRANEIRELHRYILGSVSASGRYKRFENAIGGSTHRTASVTDTPRVMLDLADWWGGGTPDPLLTATVVHAWLAHIHPFEDGNGRLSRILANLELSRHGYPALTLRAASDRGEYYTALAASDQGDLLPLYDLFGKVLRRQAKIMARPDYVLATIEDRLLASDGQRHRFWLTTLELFASALAGSLERRGAILENQGSLDPGSFSLLCERDLEGNGWFAKVRRQNRQSEWLLWFGYRSDDWIDIDSSTTYPSIFISRRDRSSEALHPYTWNFSASDVVGKLPDEIGIIPAVHSPVHFRNNFDIWELRPDVAAEKIAESLASVL
jgi:Fic family protein